MHAKGRPLRRQIDLNLLELFDVVFRTRNLTASGALLGLSQPAVSRGLARLREMYGNALFVRQQRGVQATPFAEQLAEPVAAALALVRGTIERSDFDPRTDQRCFRVAMSDIGERHFLPRLWHYLAEHAPAITLETLAAPRDALLTGMASGEIDLAVGFLADLGKQFHRQRLFRERFVYIAGAQHPHINGRLDGAALRGLRHVVPSQPGTAHAAAVEKVLTGPRVRADIALRVRSFLCLAPVVAETELVAVVPSNLAAQVSGHLALQIIEPPVRFPGFDVSLVWHRRHHQEPGNAWLRHVLVQLFADRHATMRSHAD